MNNDKFFGYLRKKESGVFGTRLSQPQVNGINSILSACKKYNVTNAHHIAHILAHVYHETGTYMSPIKETVYQSHTNKNPSDATVISRLNNAHAKGQLPWVRTIYWREGWFGRGQIQITHKTNYEKMGKKIGVNLVANPSLALELDNSAAIAVLGMRDGDFTGKKLSDYNFPSALNARWQDHPRRIVNGQDGTDGKIRNYHNGFYSALQYAGYNGVLNSPEGVVESIQPVSGTDTLKTTGSLWEALAALFKAIFGKRS